MTTYITNATKMTARLSLAVVILGSAGAIGTTAVAAADPLPYGPYTCSQGYVWRQASPSDIVCVIPPVRDQTAQQNSLAAQNREPAGGPYGPDTCKQGFVWREAFSGDHVCVTPDVRSNAAAANQDNSDHLAVNEANHGPIDPGVNQIPIPGR